MIDIDPDEGFLSLSPSVQFCSSENGNHDNRCGMRLWEVMGLVYGKHSNSTWERTCSINIRHHPKATDEVTERQVDFMTPRTPKYSQVDRTFFF